VPPQLATLVFAVGFLGLFCLIAIAMPGPRPHSGFRSSGSPWGLATFSQWSAPDADNSPDDYIDGSPLDRAILTG